MPVTWQITLDTPLGPLSLRGDARVITAVDWDDGATVGAVGSRHPLAHRAAEHLAAWFADPSMPLDLPLAPAATPYQQRVRTALLAIPAGETRTYGELAAELDSAPRAVGTACAANPLLILVPCHRVVARQGLGGYRGGAPDRALERKRWLLAYERGQR